MPSLPRIRSDAPAATSASASGEPTCAMQLCPWASHRRTRVTAKHLRALLAVGCAEAHHDPQTGKEKPGWVARIDKDGRNRAD